MSLFKQRIMSTPSRRIVIVGGVAAGPSAAARARRVDPNAEIIVFHQDTDMSYGVCEMPAVLSGEIATMERLVFFDAETFRREKGVEVRLGHRVEDIHVARKRIVVRDLATNSETLERYDRLILAVGSRARVDPALPLDVCNLHVLRSLDDGRRLQTAIESFSQPRIVILGAGYIGVEIADALHRRGLTPTLVMSDSLPLPGFDTSVRAHILTLLQAAGCTVVPDATITGVRRDGDRLTGITTTQGHFEVDLVLCALGFEPRGELAERAGIRLGPLGGIQVDQRQMTSSDGIYAAGDCCELLNPITRKTMRSAFASLAQRTGRIAGENAAGGRAELHGVIPVSAISVFGTECAHTGLTEDEARAHGFRTHVARIQSPSRVSIMPGALPLTATLVADERTERILGADIMGGEFAALRINTMSLAIRQQLTVSTFLDSDFLYTPRLSPLTDPFTVCARQVLHSLAAGKASHPITKI